MSTSATGRPVQGVRDGCESAVNEVRLVGRVSGEAQERQLPSGDSVVQLRVVVPRGRTSSRRAAGASGRITTVDTIDVACWRGPLQRKAMRLVAGDVVEVSGALRRRFWRSPGGAASRYEVEASGLKRTGSVTGR